MPHLRVEATAGLRFTTDMRRPAFFALIVALAAWPASLLAYTFTKVADSATAVPNGTGNFSSFSNMISVDALGNVAFCESNGSTNNGIYLWNAGTITRIADLNTAIPGGTGNFTNFAFFGNGIEAGRLAFRGNGASSQAGLYAYASGSLVKIADTNTAIPGGTGNFISFGTAYVDGTNYAFIAPGNSSQQGIYVSNGTTLTRIADKSSVVPGIGGTYGWSAGLGFDNGNIGFNAFITGGTNPGTALGGYTSAGGLVTLASTATAVPGAGSNFTGFNGGPPDLSGTTLAFLGQYSGGNSGIYTMDLAGGAITKIADLSTAVPGATGTFIDLQSPNIVNGTVAFQATFSGGSAQGIYLSQGGVLSKVIDTTDKIGGKTITALAIFENSLAAGYLAFRASFSDSTKGIYVTGIDIPGAPAISTQPATQSVAVGGTATFTVTASGGTLTYQWKLNGTALLGATSATLTLTNVQLANAGSYTVDVTNSSGTTTSAAAVLTVVTVSGQTAQIYVVNQGSLSVGEYSAPTGAAINASLVSGLGSHPTVLALSGGMLFVADSVSNTIAIYDAVTGAAINTSFVTGLNSPNGIALAGSYLFARSTSTSLGQYNVTTGAAVSTSFVTGLSNPMGIAVSGNKLFVANYGSNTIGVYDATTGAVINASFVTGLSTPLAIAVSGNSLFIANYSSASSGSIGVYDATTGAAINASLMTGLTAPRGIAVSGNSLYALNYNAGTIGEYNATTGAVVNAALVTGLSIPSGIAVAAAPTAPSISTQPATQSAVVGGTATFTVTASGGTLTYQWKLNGTALLGATSATLTLTNVQLANAGSYTVDVTNSSGTTTSAAAVLTVAAGSANYLANLSVRVAMAAGQTLIVGFVVDGGAKPMLVRAAGPVLNKYGLTGVVDPQLKLFNGSNTQVAVNDNWDSALATAFATLGAFPFDASSKDAALQQTISGPHSAQATATGPGALLVEAYDAGPNDGRKLINLSARFQVGTGDNILIAGFVVSGTGTVQLLIRAVGPTLTNYGVSGVLADPQLGIFDSSGTQIASNDNWSSSLSSTFTTLGAFALNAASKDAAIVATLQAGKLYTVQVSGVGNTTGEALVEIYAIP
jgi:YVTN family beta-propeller protein